MSGPTAKGGGEPPGEMQSPSTRTGPPSLSPITIGVWALTLPIVFAEITETIVGLIDTIFLAHVGMIELGAVGLGDTIYDISKVLLIALVDGLQITIARRVGERRDAAAGELFNHGMLLLAALSVGFAAALKLASPHIVSIAIEDRGVAQAVDAFLQILAFGLVFHAANLALSALFISLGRTRVLIGATLTLGLTNLCLDYVLIFGKLGLPAMGIRGAALGSVIAEIATFVYMTIYALRQVDFRRYGLFRLPSLSGKLTRGLLMISWPVALQALTEAGRWFAFFLILEKVSTEALAFSNIFYCCFAVFLIAGEAFSEAACSRVSSLIGAERAGQIVPFVWHLVLRCWLASLPFVLPAVLFPKEILGIFVSGDMLMEGSVGALRLIALASLVVVPGQIWSAAVVGTGDTLAALVVELMLTAVMLAGAYIAALTLDLSLVWAWMAVPLGWIVCYTASYAWVKSGKWERLQI